MTDPSLQFLLQNLLTVDGVPELEMVLAGTLDGLVKAVAYRDPDTADDAVAEKLAAASATLMQLAAECLHQQGDSLRQLPIEGTRYWYLVVAAGPHTYLAARADHNADLDIVFSALHKMVISVREELAAQERQREELTWMPSGTAES